MLRKSLMLALVLAFAVPLVVSPGSAHSPVTPIPNCSPVATQAEHHYAVGASLETQPVDWRTTVALFDTCANPGDLDPDYGVGGGWLPVDHHGQVTNGTWEAYVCAYDDVTTLANVYYPVHFKVGVVDFANNVQIVAQGSGCVFVSEPTPYWAFGGPSPSADGGVWVFVENHEDHHASTRLHVEAQAPTTGHIYTIP